MALRISDMSDDFIRRIVEEYLKFLATMDTVAEKFKTTPATISNVLFKAVSENIIDDITAQAVVSKAKSFTKNVVRTHRRWDEAMKLRKTPASNQLQSYKTQLEAHQYAIEELNAKIEQVEFQLETYEDFFFDEPDAPSKRTLRCTICRMKNKVSEHQKAMTECKDIIAKLTK